MCVQSFMINPLVSMGVPDVPPQMIWDVRSWFGYMAIDHGALITETMCHVSATAMDEYAVDDVLEQMIRVYPDERSLSPKYFREIGTVCWYLFRDEQTSECAIELLTALFALGMDIDQLHESCLESGCQDACHTISTDVRLHVLRGYLDTYLAHTCCVPWDPEWPDMAAFVHGHSNSVFCHQCYHDHPLSHDVQRMISVCKDTYLLPEMVMEITLAYAGVDCHAAHMTSLKEL